MSDPKFAGFDDLVAWRQAQVEEFMRDAPFARNQATLMIQVADRITRVTKAHFEIWTHTGGAA